MDYRPLVYNPKNKPQYLFDIEKIKVVNDESISDVIINKVDSKVTLNEVYFKTNIFAIYIFSDDQNIIDSIFKQTFPQNLIKIILLTSSNKTLNSNCIVADRYFECANAKIKVIVKKPLPPTALHYIYMMAINNLDIDYFYNDKVEVEKVFGTKQNKRKIQSDFTQISKFNVSNFDITVYVVVLDKIEELSKTIQSIEQQTFYYLKTNVHIITISNKFKDPITKYPHIFTLDQNYCNVDYGYITYLDSGNYYTSRDYLDNMINMAFLSKADTVISGCCDHKNNYMHKAGIVPKTKCYTMLHKIHGVTKPSLEMNKTNDIMYLIIPYRNRQEHLTKFVPYMKTYLDKLNIPHKFIVAQQTDDDCFRLGLLINVAVKYIMKNNDMTNSYFCKHDIDTIPIVTNNYYRPENGVINKVYGYYDCLSSCFTFNGEDFVKMNGISNSFDGWGGEDTDSFARALKSGIKVETKFQYFRGDNKAYNEFKTANENLSTKIYSKNFDRNLWLSMFDQYDYTKDGINQLDISSVTEEKSDSYIALNIDTTKIIKNLERRI